MAGGVGEIVRQTIHVFFRHYHTFASIAGLAVFPASASLLLSHALLPSSSPLLNTIQLRFRSLFVAAGFPVTTDFFSLVGLKLSQTIFTFLFTLPFAFTFLLIAKASIISIVNSQLQSPSPPSYSMRIYTTLLKTTVCNSMAVLTTNAAVFSFLFLVFNTADVVFGSSSTMILALSALGAIMYSIILAHVIVICNLSVIVSAVDNQGGFLPFLKAFFLVRSRPSTALALAIPANLGMAAVEGLFQYRVIKPYYNNNQNHTTHTSLVLETISIVYIHSLLVVLDVIATCLFFNTCRLRLREQQEANSAASVNQKLQEIL